MQKVLTLAFVFLATVGLAQTARVDSLLRVVARHTGDTTEVLAIDALAGEFMRSDIHKALHLAHQQLALARTLGHQNGMSYAYTTLVHGNQISGHLDSSRYYLDQYETFYRRDSANKRIGINYANTAGLFYKNQGRYNEALPYLLEALQLIGAGGDKTSQAGQMLNIGNVYYNLGDLKNAATYHLKALRLFEAVRNKRGQSFCLQSLGSDFLRLRQYAVAEKYFLQSVKIKEEERDKRGSLSSWMSLGELYQQTNKLELSMLYSNKALMRARELKMTGEESHVLFNMASLLKATKKVAEARKLFTETLVLARQTGDSLFVSTIRSELVMMEGDLQKEKKEEQTLVGNITISLEKGDRSLTADGHHKLAEWYAGRGQFEKAFDHLKQMQQLDDSVRGNDVLMQLRNLEEEYKNEKKDREITLLKKDQELQSLALSRQKVIIVAIVLLLFSVVVIGLLLINRYRVMNRAKRALEIERVRNNIARDLHDEMGSALSSINILSQVALVEKNENAQSYLQRIGDQSSRIMENMGDMVWSINPGNDSMNQVIIRMREFATEILDAKNMGYVFSEKVAEDLMIGTDKRKNLFLIFKETLNNTAKYSNATLVEISLYQQKDKLILCVKDNGLGFDESTTRAGNGLRNVRERARELGGTVSIKSAPGEGTDVELQVPIA